MKRLFTLICFVFFSAFGFAESASDHYDNARKAWESSDWEKVSAELTALSAVYDGGDLCRLRYLLAVTYLNLGKADQAAGLFQTVSASCQLAKIDDARNSYYQALALTEAHKSGKAFEALRVVNADSAELDTDPALRRNLLDFQAQLAMNVALPPLAVLYAARAECIATNEDPPPPPNCLSAAEFRAVRAELPMNASDMQELADVLARKVSPDQSAHVQTLTEEIKTRTPKRIGVKFELPPPLGRVAENDTKHERSPETGSAPAVAGTAKTTENPDEPVKPTASYRVGVSLGAHFGGLNIDDKINAQTAQLTANRVPEVGLRGEYPLGPQIALVADADVGAFSIPAVAGAVFTKADTLLWNLHVGLLRDFHDEKVPLRVGLLVGVDKVPFVRADISALRVNDILLPGLGLEAEYTALSSPTFSVAAQARAIFGATFSNRADRISSRWLIDLSVPISHSFGAAGVFSFAPGYQLWKTTSTVDSETYGAFGLQLAWRQSFGALQ